MLILDFNDDLTIITMESSNGKERKEITNFNYLGLRWKAEEKKSICASYLFWNTCYELQII